MIFQYLYLDYEVYIAIRIYTVAVYTIKNINLFTERKTKWYSLTRVESLR